MIPRYRIGWTAGDGWRCLASAPGAVSAARDRLRERLSPEPGRSAHAFLSARLALYACFLETRRERGPGGEVVIPAQICPVVADAVIEAGLRPRPIDLALGRPTPSPDQYRKAVRPETVALVIAPIYGYLPIDWSALLRNRPAARIILDLAQGLGGGDAFPDLFRAADDVIYSFGPGKGIDVGGGLWFTRGDADLAWAEPGGFASVLGTVARGLGLAAVQAAGLHRLVAGRLDRRRESFRAPASGRALAPPRLHVPWSDGVERFLVEMETARRRGRELLSLPRLRELCRDAAHDEAPACGPLRQLVRFRDGSRRDRVLAALRRGAVDCAPAGEPLPSEYLGDGTDSDYPEARSFRKETIRLPFLGRLTEREFARLRDRTEEALD